jgi:glycosyltransferase involved in cell wall biosynthesis
LKNVAVVTPWFPNRPGDWAGAFVADSALAVSRAGWRVGVVVVRPWWPHWARRFAHEMVRGEISAAAFPLAAIKTVRVPAMPRAMLQRFTNIVSDRLVVDAIARMAEEISADLIHVQTEGIAPIAARVAHRLRLPFVVTLHGINTDPRYLQDSYQTRRLRPALASAECIILVGEPLREFFSSYIGSDANFQVVPNGIDLPPRRLARTAANGIWRLVSVANLHEGKGVDLTLQALARLQRDGVSNWTYRVIGEGREKAALLKFTAESGLADKVTFIGSVRHAEIFDQLVNADVFVLPSYREAFGIVYLEAMAAGLLTIGVAGQGPSQFIRNGENGVLVPPRDVDALVVALHNILTGDRERWCEIARKGRESVQSSYVWDNHARRLIDVYVHAIGKSNC